MNASGAAVRADSRSTLPNFLVVGAMKAGTTTAYELLRQHPDVYVSPEKEPRHFALADTEPGDFKGPSDPANRCPYRDLGDYASLFEGAEGESAIGEASTIYLYSETAPRAISELIPDARIVAILRNPIERAFSNYVYARMEGREPLEDFADALEAEAERIEAGWGPYWHYARKGLYGRQLERYYEQFPENQIEILRFRDLRDGVQGFGRQLYEAVGVSTEFAPSPVAANPSGEPRSWFGSVVLSKRKSLVRTVGRVVLPSTLKEKMKELARGRLQRRDSSSVSRRTRERLVDFYASDVELLERLTGMRFSHWLS